MRTSPTLEEAKEDRASATRKRIDLCSDHYAPKVTPAILEWVRSKVAHTVIPLQAKELKQSIEDAFGVVVSITTVYRILHTELAMSYKRIYRGEIRSKVS